SGNDYRAIVFNELSVTWNGRQLGFKFFSDSIAAAYVTSSQRAVLDERANNAIEYTHGRTVQQPQPPAAPPRCRDRGAPKREDHRASGAGHSLQTLQRHHPRRLRNMPALRSAQVFMSRRVAT